MVQGLRQSGITSPFMLMGSYNPILSFGVERFCRVCRDVGVDGLIVPDLPPEEGSALDNGRRQNGLAMSYLLAPTSTPERVRLVSERSQGFVYLVSVTGVTGAREQLAGDLSAFVQRVRQVTGKPLAVGFGISTPEQASRVAELADGVIVGSALVRLASDKNKVNSLVAELRRAVEIGKRNR
jgi:tryptophan synthase alpha chain